MRIHVYKQNPYICEYINILKDLGRGKQKSSAQIPLGVIKFPQRKTLQIHMSSYICSVAVGQIGISENHSVKISLELHVYVPI